jgi:pimeloyl-ACP methyl ester carboxylesterase
MKRLATLFIAAGLVAGVSATPSADARMVIADPHATGRYRPIPEARSLLASRPGMAFRTAPDSAKAASLPGGRALAKRAGLSPCGFDDSLLCGRITPPLERGNPAAGTVTVRFVVAPHTGASPTPRGAVFSTSGGPGNSITGSNGEMYPFRDFVLSGIRQRWDLVFIDQRGVGRSGALNCPGWQHDMSYRLAAQCAALFGDRRNDYSSKAVAEDTDDIRQALGYDQIVVMGGSYGGNDAVTYAMRHPEHTEAVVAGSPSMGTSPFDPFAATTPEAEPGVAARHCRRSVVCAQQYPHPFPLIRSLIRHVRSSPVTGVGYDSDGQPHHVRVTESMLAWWIMQDSDFPFSVAQIVPAAAALRRGDETPLLRLAAQSDPKTIDWDSGDVRSYSNADNLFRFCTDHDFPWDENAPRDVRYRQFRHAKAAQPWRYGMFRRNAWTVAFPFGFFPDPCITARWNHHEAYPPNATVAGVPTLVLTGDYDLVTPTAYSAVVTDLLADSTLIEVKSAAHNPWFWRRCAGRIVRHFIQTNDATDACAGKRPPRFWTPGSFPVWSANAPQAQPLPGDESTAGDRRLALVSAWTVMDTVESLFRSGTLSGRGLRGGTTAVTFPPAPPKPAVYRLHGARFTRDVAVSGKAFWDWSNLLYGSVEVSRAHGAPVTLHLRGHFYTPGQRFIRVRGTIDGRTVRVTVPAY